MAAIPLDLDLKDHLPPISDVKKHCFSAYQNFVDWQSFKGIEPNDFSKYVLMFYFQELSMIYPRRTLLRIYQMLRYALRLRHNIDISKYPRLFN